MIAQLSGKVVRTEANSVVLDVNGVGYQVFVPIGTLSKLGEVDNKATLITHLIVREDELTLYGFEDKAQLHAFKLLIGVTGVGPKVALAMLSTLSTGELAIALAASDTKMITRVPGVGPKLASRLCMELADKFSGWAGGTGEDFTATGSAATVKNAACEDAVEALVGLGYSRADSRKAVDRAAATGVDNSNAGNLIRECLALLTKSR